MSFINEMKPTNKRFADGNSTNVQPVYHLVHDTSNSKPLCGETSPDAVIGSYTEHIDATTTESARWVREVFDSNGKTVSPCRLCLSLYPPVLLDVVPFELKINVHFKPNKALNGYNVTTDAFASIGRFSKPIETLANLGYLSASWIGSLKFSLDIDANPVVTLVECANKTKNIED